MREETFSFWMPLAKAGEDADGKRWIEGIASDDGEDLQGEKVVQKGLDVDYFVRRGFFNWDHQDVVAVKGGTGVERLAIGKIGEPTVAQLTPQGLFVKGFLYRGNPLADAAWELARSLEASGASRRLGFSIQGKTLRKDGNRIAKAWIQDVAITPAPVNPRTYLDVCKGLGTTAEELGKALSTGYAKGEDAPAAEGEGGALRPESLEGTPCDRCGNPACTDSDRDHDDKALDEELPGDALEKALEVAFVDALEKGLLGAAVGAARGAVKKFGQRLKNRVTSGKFLADAEPWTDQHGIPRTGPDGWVADPTGEHHGGGPGGTYPVTPSSRNRAGHYGRSALLDPDARPQKALSRDEAVTFIQLEKGYSRTTAELTADLLFEAARLGRQARA